MTKNEWYVNYFISGRIGFEVTLINDMMLISSPVSSKTSPWAASKG